MLTLIFHGLSGLRPGWPSLVEVSDSTLGAQLSPFFGSCSLWLREVLLLCLLTAHCA